MLKLEILYQYQNMKEIQSEFDKVVSVIDVLLLLLDYKANLLILSVRS